jgi:hypothetical protein
MATENPVRDQQPIDCRGRHGFRQSLDEGSMKQTTVTRTIIAAVGDWQLAVYCPPDGSDPERCYYEPIIAWEIEQHEAPEKEGTSIRVNPITTEGKPDNLKHQWGIRLSDGRIDIPHVRMCENEAVFLEAGRKTVEAEGARIKKK